MGTMPSAMKSKNIGNSLHSKKEIIENQKIITKKNNIGRVVNLNTIL